MYVCNTGLDCDECIGGCEANLELEDGFADDFRKTKWTIGFKDRGLGHGDFAVMASAQDVVVECPSREVANHIIELHNKSLGVVVSFEKRLAQAVLAAMKIREDSYDRKAADEASKSREFVDFLKFYKKSYDEAAEEAVKNAGFDVKMSLLIYLLIKYTWNDIGDWAKEIVGS